MWYRNCLEEIGRQVAEPTCIYEDNAATIIMSETSVISKRTRHMDIKYKFLNEKVKEGLIKLNKVEGIKNIADIFTKALPRDRFIFLSSHLVRASTSLSVPQPLPQIKMGRPEHVKEPLLRHGRNAEPL